MNRMAVGLAVGAGYVLGRTKKAKFAFAVGTMVAGKRLNLSPKALGAFVNQQLQNNPQFKEIGDQLRQDMRGVGKAATGSLLNRQLEGLADRLHDRTLGVQDRIAGVVPGQADDADEDEDTESRDEDQDTESRDEDRDQGEDRDEDAKPERSAQRKKAPSKRTARKPDEKPDAKSAPKAAAKKTPAKKSPQKTARKTAQKKSTAAARGTARRAASSSRSGGRAKGGSDHG